MASPPVYQFYAELDYFKPLIWRRFQVAGNTTVARLGYITMTLFEMTASHQFSFDSPVTADDQEYIWHYEVPLDGETYLEETEFFKLLDARKHKLTGIIGEKGGCFNFTYDFGDNWEITLILENVFKDKELPIDDLPRVIEGEGFGIIEDCGGIGGLDELVKAFKEKKGQRYLELSRWYGKKDFDVTAFDLDDMNFRLKKLPLIYKKCYESQRYPTRKALDLIERKYLK